MCRAEYVEGVGGWGGIMNHGLDMRELKEPCRTQQVVLFQGSIEKENTSTDALNARMNPD